MDIQGFKLMYTCPATGDVRFRMRTLTAALGAKPGRTADRVQAALLRTVARKLKTKARVNDGGSTLKKFVFSVRLEDWDLFVSQLGSVVAEIHREEEAVQLTLEQRVRRLELMLNIGQ